MKGSGAKPYVLKNTGGVYSCTCPAWRNQSVAIERRTCKHLRKLRGDAAEEARLGGALPQKPVRQASEDGDDGDAGPPLLLAESWNNADDLAGWWMSEKLDGVPRLLGRQTVPLATGQPVPRARLVHRRVSRDSARRRVVDRSQKVPAHRQHRAETG
jgi:hypothetical protein